MNEAVPTIAFATLGCKVNQVETEQFKEAFRVLGYREVDFAKAADIYVINTCTVTHVSDRKSRALMRRAVRTNPSAWLVVTGCMAQILAAKTADIAPAHLIIGNSRKDHLPKLVHEKIQASLGIRPESAEVIVPAFSHNEELLPVGYAKKHQRTRAFLKIQDGCQSYCTFCIVPKARGMVRSKPPEAIWQEIGHLVKLGYREVVLTGIHIGQYGIDLNGWNLTKLLSYLLKSSVETDLTIRLGSIEPLEFSDELIELIADNPKVCRHFHIPLQSASLKLLQAMHRRYTPDEYQELLHKLYKTFPQAALAADVMVGFPGETEEEFQAGYDFIRKLPLNDLHIFKYSKRPETAACLLPGQVAQADKDKRSARLIKLAQLKKRDFLQQFIGESLSVLVEQEKHPGIYLGLSDNYIEVEIISEQPLILGERQIVYCTRLQEDKVLGRIF